MFPSVAMPGPKEPCHTLRSDLISPFLLEWLARRLIVNLLTLFEPVELYLMLFINSRARVIRLWIEGRDKYSYTRA